MRTSARPLWTPGVPPWRSWAARSIALLLRSNPISCRSVSNAANMMREPAFWWRDAGIAARVLAPAAAAYGAVARARLNWRGHRVATPVVCIGNLTVGGGGKTPAALTTARLLQAAGELPVFLTRGYGGTLAGPVKVDAATHNAAEVGDEPLLLAHAAPTIFARARFAVAAMESRRVQASSSWTTGSKIPRFART